MKEEKCECCGSSYFVDNYTQEQLRNALLTVIARWSDKKTSDEILQYLAAQGFLLSHLKIEMTRLWDNKVVEFVGDRCRIVYENPT